MSFFAKPEEKKENPYGVKILYLHGLEGSSEGSKATHLRNEWSAFTPNIRTQTVAALKEKCAGNWSKLSHEEINESLEVPYSDAVDAVKYLKPDIIVGSSLGAALLYKIYADGYHDGPAVFLAPAIPHLLSQEVLSQSKQNIRDRNSVWILAELDSIVSNADNVVIANSVGGSILYSPSDEHRLSKALSRGLIDAAVLTAIEFLNRS